MQPTQNWLSAIEASGKNQDARGVGSEEGMGMGMGEFRGWSLINLTQPHPGAKGAAGVK